MSDEPEFVVIRTYLNAVEAQILKMTLDAAEIDATIRADDCGGARPHMWMGGVDLLVNPADVAKAEEVLAGLDADQSAAEAPALDPIPRGDA